MKALQDLYPPDFAHCYGCGRSNSSGNHLKSYIEGDAVIARFTPGEHHISVPGFVYGGLLASLVDCHAMATAASNDVTADFAPRYVTAVLHVEYVKPTPLGPELEIRGRVKERTQKKAVVALTVSVAGMVTLQ